MLFFVYNDFGPTRFQSRFLEGYEIEKIRQEIA